MPHNEIETDAGSDAAFAGREDGTTFRGAEDPPGNRARRGIMRLRHTRRAVETPGSEARIEILGDRIELLEYALNEYIDKIDAVATHATRISVDRLIPAVDKLSQVVRDSRAAHGGPGPAPEPPARAEPDDGTNALAAELAGLTARLAEVETRLAALPDRIRIAAAPPFPSADAEARRRAHLFSALTAISRQQQALRDHVDSRLDALQAQASESDLQVLGDRIAGCEEDLARIPQTVRSAAAATLPDMDALTRSLDALREAIARGEERQAEAQALLLDRIRSLADPSTPPDQAAMRARLDAMGETLAALPERITVAAAPPALTGNDDQRSAIARTFAAVSALTRQQDQFAATICERLDRLEQQVVDRQAPASTVTAEALAKEMKAHLRDLVRPGVTADAAALLRTTQNGERKTSVALARIERVLTALASRDPGDPKALDDMRMDARARSARVLDAIADFRSEMSESLASAASMDTASRAVVHAALAELLAIAQRDAAQD